MISALDAQKRAFGVEIEGLEQENQAENWKISAPRTITGISLNCSAFPYSAYCRVSHE
jgi:hypothetical protein